ncbi:MAG: DUF2169 domain-containing protein [Thermodesulfobacteriota bacterium]|nr:DUF2169 domain-containing protein [Thermodesulfobacteriota bacterium]
MKIFKKSDHSLLIKTFGIKDTLYLATTILIFFDLTSPDDPLTEQELWKAIPDELGQGGVLDMGMPKPRGEVLITGKCFAPRGTNRPASEVSFRIGDLRKSLNIFGDRFWKRTGGVNVISDPQPFKEMGISWQNAFGGEGFDKNPLGKGIASVLSPEGQTIIPLPNIENPEHLIGSPADQPEPACFGPIDLMWPQRFKKQGTYDEKWQRERWPHFPDDMNYEFFNTAPEDQFIAGIFTGDETIEIKNMHSDIQVINSHLPRIRVRCFVTKKKSLKAGHEEDEIFQEATTHIDTIWLFPSILRGVVMYRGTTEVLDDEYADVSRIFLASENMADEPKPIEYYLEEQKKVLDRMVPIDPAPLEAAQKKIGEAMKRVKNIPKDIETAKLKAMGKSPKMQRSPEEMAAQGREVIQKGMTLVSDMEIQTQQMLTDYRAKYGHLVKIPSVKFDNIKEKLKDTEKRLDDAMAEVQKAQKESEEAKKGISDELKKNVSPEDLKKTGIDPDNLLAEQSVNPWHDRGFPMVIKWRKNLEQDHKIQNALYKLGFNRRTIQRAWFGINPEEQAEDAELWGLQPGTDDQGQPKALIIPSGLIMPRFDEATLNRVLIRSGDYTDSGKDVLIEGSDEIPLFLPSVDPEGAPVIRVSDELEARLVEQEIGDACSVIALQNHEEKPDKDAAKNIEDAPVFLIVLPEKAEESEKDWEPWEKAYPDAQKLFLPKGNTVFEARKHGTDIRKWIMEALPSDFAQKHQIEPAMPEPGKPPEKSPMEGLAIPVLDIKGMVDKFTKDIRAFHQPKIDEAMAMKKEMEKKAKEAIIKAGKDPEAVLSAAKGQPMKPFSKIGDDIAKTITEERERLRAAGHLTPEIESKMNASAAKAAQMGHDGEKQYQEGMAKVAAGKKDAEQAKAGGIPDSVKEKFDKAGIDPEKIKKLTREEVIERYEKGESLEGAILSEIDLSKLDLHGINLSQAQCQKTKFCESNLDGAIFNQTLAQEADFSKASLRNMKSEKGIFSKALFKEANIASADIDSAILQEADLTKANCAGAKLKMTILQKAKLNQVNLADADANMCVFSDADASDADFGRVKLFKCLFQKTVLDRADFSGAAINSTMFMGVKGEGVTFEGANMDKARMGGNASLPGANFRNVSMKHGCFRDSDLSGADFRGSTLDESILENCNLANATLSGVPAKKCRFNKSNLENADLSGVNLFMGSLRKARIVNTNLSDSNLFAVDFYKATAGETNFEGANLKMSQLHKRTDLLD